MQLKKDHDRIYLNEEKINQYSYVKHIVVMGFSFNDIDLPYIYKKICDMKISIRQMPIGHCTGMKREKILR